MTTYQVEPVAVWEAESTALVYAHWQELGLDLDLEIAPDFEKMKVIEKIGMFKVITVRKDAHMVGYLLAIVSEHLHYRTSPKMLIVDAYFIAPECRNGTGIGLVQFTEALAKDLGCIKVYFSCKVHRDFSKMFLALGYRLSDLAFTKRL